MSDIKRSKAESKALVFFQKRFEKMDEARKEHFERFREDEKLFRSHLEVARKADWQSQYFIPRTYGLVMASLSEFAINKPDISVEPDTRADALRVPYMKAVMHANWRKNKGNAEMLYVLLDALKLGIGIYEIGYRKDKRMIKEIENDPEDYNKKGKWKKKEIVDFDDVFFEVVNPRYMWIDESASSFTDAIDCVRKYKYGEQAFHQRFDSKFPKAKNVQPRSELEDEEFYRPFIGRNLTEEVVVFKYMNKAKDVIWWIANGKLLNNPDDPIPFHHKQLPYAEIRLAPYDKYTFYGISLPHMIKDIQHELNTLRNMMTDQTHLNIFSPFFYSAEEDLDESVFTIEPGMGIPVNNAEGFSFFKQGQIGQDAYKVMDQFDDDARQTTGFDLRLQGLPSGGTATETAILKETALKRINLYLRFMEDFNMPEFSELWKDTIQQFYFTSSEIKKHKKENKDGSEREEIFRSLKIPRADVSSFRTVESVGDFNFLSVTEADIRGKFDANVRIGSSIAVSRELDKQTKLSLYAVMSAEELIKREKLVVDVLKAHEMDPEEYMNITPQVDTAQSLALAEEHNKQIIAGQKPQIIPDLITPEHIQLHDALIKSDNVSAKVKAKLRSHAMEEMRSSKIGGVGLGGAEQRISSPAIEKNPQLDKKLSSVGGLPNSTVRPITPAEVSPMIGKPTIKP